MSDRILVTGATGFLGSYVVPLLERRGAEVACLVRPTSDTRQLEALGLELRVADLADAPRLRQALQDREVLVNLASLGFGHAPNIVKAAVQAGIRRAVFLSTTAIFTSLPARSRRLRLEAETLVRGSGLAYTVLRPTMIYGAAHDRNIARLIRYLERYPIVFVPGSGPALQQPVFVEDVAGAVLAALDRSESTGRSYNLAGPQPLSLDELIDATARALGRRVLRVHLPLGTVALGVGLAARLRLPLPITPEQVLRLDEHKDFDIQPARQDLGFDPLPFEQGVQREVASIRSAADAPGPQPAPARGGPLGSSE